ncbi:MAG: peptidoglycan-binding protein [Deltaproteobacteria bacterium 37-65-8]|nr:MAG: peptidoglycan-binding protein [Deltaproteobacteria bacterium 37-65-8]
MQKLIISLICCLLPAFTLAATPEIRDNAPDRHIVVKGDTLWDISATFFKDPWKWPQIWGMNKDTIKDPHWIYPGDVIVLDRTTGTLRVGGEAKASSPDTVVKLSPKARAQSSEHNAIPSIPGNAIGPFLSRPLVIEENELSGAPTLVGTYEQRVILGNDDIAYVKGLSEGKGSLWQVYRPGKTFLDPDSKEVLGHEAIYLGDVSVEKFADLSTVKITKSIQEINKGDRLVQATGELASNYVPHAPESQFAARVISIYGGVSQAGQNAIITLNKGRRDGLENGHVLALYRKGETVKEKGKDLTLPDVRYGLLFVFRTFDKVAYALVMQTRLPVELLDSAQTP